MGYGALKRACKENERDHVDDPRSVLINSFQIRTLYTYFSLFNGSGTSG